MKSLTLGLGLAPLLVGAILLVTGTLPALAIALMILGGLALSVALYGAAAAD